MTRFKHLLVLLVGLVTLATLAPVASAANAPDRPRSNAAAPDAVRYHGSTQDGITSPAAKIRFGSHTDGVRYQSAAPEVIRYKAFVPNPRCTFCKADRL